LAKNKQDNLTTLNINDSINNLVKAYPEVQRIMNSLGFTDITNPIMLKTVGKIMTIKRGAKMRGIDLEKIKTTFLEYGFLLEDKNEWINK